MLENNDDELSSTIEQLYHDFSSGVPSLEISEPAACCCGQVDCSSFKEWQDIKLQLQNQLHLSAELGQALLQRHEALISRHQKCQDSDTPCSEITMETGTQKTDYSDNDIISELQDKKDNLAEELHQSMIEIERLETSLTKAEQQLEEARNEVSHLTIIHANCATLEHRLLIVQGERDDMQQERDVHAVRVTVLEHKLNQSHARANTLDSEIHQLQYELQQKDRALKGSTRSLLQDAKSRQKTGMPSRTTATENAEYLKILESASQQKADLLKENAELQMFLAEARDELHILRQEFEEQGAQLAQNKYQEVQGELALAIQERQSNITTQLDEELQEHLQSQTSQVAGLNISSSSSSWIATICANVIQLLFLVGMISYWLYFAKVMGNILPEYSSQPGRVGFLLPGVVMFGFLQKQTTTKPILVSATTFIGTLSFAFVGWWVVSKIAETLALVCFIYSLGSTAYTRVKYH
ncbi:hypothetical protein EV360DRAFT_87679 [Lentinula raphanica]|nr:hypothetical protein EV360DRAFT_87679 [Lentinula raphanica]